MGVGRVMPKEFCVDVSPEDYPTMLPYWLNLIVDGLPAERVDDNTIMIKYKGYALINTEDKVIKSVIQRPE